MDVVCTIKELYLDRVIFIIHDERNMHKIAVTGSLMKIKKKNEFHRKVYRKL